MKRDMLDVTGLHVSFRDRSRRFTGSRRRVRAVRGVDFSIKAGSCVGLIGESGCGKSTLARAVLGLVAIDAGKVVFDGVDLSKLRGPKLQRTRQNMQMIFQQASDSMNPRMTVEAIVGDPLRFAPQCAKNERQDRVTEALRTVNLDAGLRVRFPHELSGGQLQRVALARALVLEPDFLVCDEPISALDVTAQDEILDELAAIHQARCLTTLFITHDLDVAAIMGDEIAVMYLGRIVERGSVPDVMNHPAHPYAFYLGVARSNLSRTDERQTPPLQGSPPSPVHPPGGCSFHPRCPLATEVCCNESPKLVSIGSPNTDHVVACHHSDRIAELPNLAAPGDDAGTLAGDGAPAKA